jgi:hypothetical protein
VSVRRQRLALSVIPDCVLSISRRRNNPAPEAMWFKWKTGRWIMSRILRVRQFYFFNGLLIDTFQLPMFHISSDGLIELIGPVRKSWCNPGVTLPFRRRNGEIYQNPNSRWPVYRTWIEASIFHKQVQRVKTRTACSVINFDEIWHWCWTLNFVERIWFWHMSNMNSTQMFCNVLGRRPLYELLLGLHIPQRMDRDIALWIM